MIQNKTLKDFVDSIIEEEEDMVRLNDIISEIKTDEPDLDEPKVVGKAIKYLVEELQAAAEGMIDMGSKLRISQNRHKKLNDLGIKD
jgi:hypothetical protein